MFGNRTGTIASRVVSSTTSAAHPSVASPGGVATILFDESRPAFTSDGRCVAFVRHAESRDRLFAWDSQPQTLVNAIGVDLVGRVPLGTFSKRPGKVRWDLRVGGKRLKPGRYQVTVRAVTKKLAVRDFGRPRILRLK